MLLQVLLVPKPGTPYVPTRYDMTIERLGDGPWKVSYCTPYAPPGRYVVPEWLPRTPTGLVPPRMGVIVGRR